MRRKEEKTVKRSKYSRDSSKVVKLIVLNLSKTYLQEEAEN
jgi:hypothetical protein